MSASDIKSEVESAENEMHKRDRATADGGRCNRDKIGRGVKRMGKVV